MRLVGWAEMAADTLSIAAPISLFLYNALASSFRDSAFVHWVQRSSFARNLSTMGALVLFKVLMISSNGIPSTRFSLILTRRDPYCSLAILFFLSPATSALKPSTDSITKWMSMGFVSNVNSNLLFLPDFDRRLLPRLVALVGRVMVYARRATDATAMPPTTRLTVLFWPNMIQTVFEN